MDEQRCRLEDVELRYVETEGPSPPIMLLHGVTDSSASYRAVLLALQGRHRLLAMDFRGHGGSGHVPGRYRVCDHASDVAAFLRRIVHEPALLVGHSLGALVALAVASRHPELCRGVLLEDPPLYSARMPAFRDHPAYQMFAGLRALLQQHHASGASVDALAEVVGAWPIHPLLFEGRSLLEVAGPAVVRERAETLDGLDPAVLDPVLDGSQFEGFDPDRALATLALPVRVVAGSPELGGVIEGRDVERLASTTRRCTYRIIPDGGHFLHHVDGERYLDELRGFIACLG